MPAVPASTASSPWFLADMSGRPRVREIDIHFGLVRAAHHQGDLCKMLAGQLSLQAQQASELHSGPAECQCLLKDVRAVADNLSGHSNTSPSELQSLRETIAAQLRKVADDLTQRSNDFERVARSVRRGFPVETIGLLDEAEKNLKSGLTCLGLERNNDLANALALLQAATDTSGGATDSVAWFQIGWLQWNLTNDLANAEDAFLLASQLSSDMSDQHRVDALRHLAHIRYLRNDIAKAYETACEASELSGDLDACFDRARYASRIGLDDEAEDLLRKCTKDRPTTFIAMLSEEDFQGDH